MTQGQSVSDVLPGELRCADVIGGRGSFLTMAVVTESNPFIAVLLEIRGHPNGADQLETPSFSVSAFGDYCESNRQLRISVSKDGDVGHGAAIDRASHRRRAISSCITGRRTGHFTKELRLGRCVKARGGFT